ncbi:hypothetical protein HDU86_004148 [Geranomyces michiganensis]|nr:hypothetical protein HDU86_004148 [Geranomyces michiganensis]
MSANNNNPTAAAAAAAAVTAVPHSSATATAANNNKPDNASSQAAAVFAQFASYDWASDARFQAGLKSILPPPPAQSDPAALAQAQFFYFSKFVHPIDKERYMAWKASSSSSSSSSSSCACATPSSSMTLSQTDSAPPPPQLQSENDTATSPTVPSSNNNNLGGDAHYPRSFQEICEMVARGDEVPGIRQIPDRLNDAAPSASALGPRKKPWEKG